MRRRVYQSDLAALALFLILFAIGGVLVWALMDFVSRTDISGDGWSLRGNGALIVPVVAGPALMAAGWATLGLSFRGQRQGAGWQALGYVGVPIAVIGGFMAATFFAAPILAANDPARSGHTATLLDDGRVLIVGGSGDHGSLATAWRYDPAASRWIRAANMSVARSGHTATRLLDGRVLVVGGSFGASQPGAELYEPARDGWVPTAPMPSPRTGHAAELLSDGRVLVAGGGSDFGAADAAQIFDPATGVWSLAGSLQRSGPRLQLAALADGRILALAGNPREGPSAEVYDPVAGRWSSTAAPPGLPVVYAAATLTDGRVLALGGQLDFSGQTAAALYDPRSQSWSAAARPSLSAFEGSTTTVLADGRLLLAGGTSLSVFPPRGEPTASAELYDPARNAWSPAGSMTSARSGHSATLLADGRVLVVGGFTRSGAMATAELYEAPTGAWQRTASIGG
jgi:N-acetylneuraminic acid mutarotase